jgi:hypothetical protein
MLTFKANAQLSADTTEIFTVTTGASCGIPKLIKMGRNAICFWAQLRTDSTIITHAQSISVTGDLQWEKQGIEVGHLSDITIPLYQPNRAYDVVVLNDNEVYIAGERDLLFEQTSDLVLQRVDKNGNITWPEMWIADSNLSVDYTEYPDKRFKLIRRDDSTGWLLWAHHGSMYLRQFDQFGTGDTLNLGYYVQDATTNGEKGLYTVHWRMMSEYAHVYIRQYDSSGKMIWPNPIDAAWGRKPANPLGPFRLLTLPDRSVMMIWKTEDIDKRGHYWIYTQRVSKSGERLYDSSGIVVAREIPDMRTFDARLMPDTTVCIVYNTYSSIHAQKITQDGELSWGSQGKIVCDIEGNKGNINIEAGTDGSLVIAWLDARSSLYQFPGIYAQKLDESGRDAWTEQGRVICEGDQYKANPTLCVLDSTVMIAWEDLRQDSIGIFAAIITSKQGTLTAESNEEYASHQGHRETPLAKFIDVYPNPANEYVVVKVKEGLLRGTVRIHDCLGGLVKEFHLDGENQNAVWTLDDSYGKRVNPGIYVACVIGARQVYRTTFVVF